MSKYIYNLKKIEEKIENEENEVLVEQVKSILKNKDLTNNERSFGLYLIGEMYWMQSYQDETDPYGDIHFRKSLKYNKNNYSAILALLDIYSVYPYPYCTLITEQEYINFEKFLIENFSKLNTIERHDFWLSINDYFILRLKEIQKYNYKWYISIKSKLSNNVFNKVIFFKECVKQKKYNYNILLNLIYIFNKYPYPFYDAITEEEYIRYVELLINNFDKLDQKQQRAFLGCIEGYFNIRTYIIGKYGYDWYKKEKK